MMAIVDVKRMTHKSLFEMNTNQATSVSISALRFAGAVEFGSRALGVHEEYSDYDFAMLRSNFEIMFKDKMPTELPIKNYFKVVPPNGHNTIAIKCPTDDDKYADILILEKQEHLDMFRRAINSIKYPPSYFPWMWVKHKRIVKFEKALLEQGFRTRWPVLIANWLLKTF